MLTAVVPALVAAALILMIAVGARRPSQLRLDVDGEALRIEIRGRDGWYALCRGLTIPVASIAGVAVAPRRLVPQTGLRLPGTGIPGVLRAGSYGAGAQRDFWLVRRADLVLVIQLHPGGTYRRLVLEVPDPHAEALRLRPRLGAYAGVFAA